MSKSAATAGAIPDPSEQVYDVNPQPEPPPVPTEAERKAARLAAIAVDQVAARAGLTRYEVQRLREWHQGYYGSPVPKTMGLDVLAQLFLNPRAKWARDSENVTGYTGLSGKIQTEIRKDDGSTEKRIIDTSVVLRDGVDDFDAERAKFITVVNVFKCPTLTLQITAHSWSGSFLQPIDTAFRGESILWRGERKDPIVEQAVQMGLVRVVQDGRAPALAGVCPAPRLVDPDGMTHMKNYPLEGRLERTISVKQNPREREIEASVRAILALGTPMLGPQYQGGFSPEALPLIRCKYVAAESTHNMPFRCGDTFSAGVLWAMKVSVDQKYWMDGAPSVEITEPLPAALESYRPVLADYMLKNPGALSSDAGFPWPAEAA